MPSVSVGEGRVAKRCVAPWAGPTISRAPAAVPSKMRMASGSSTTSSSVVPAGGALLPRR